MASNPYVNKVQTADGTTIIDISDTTAVASDVAQGKYFYTAQGQKVQGSNQGGGGYVTQDANGYIILPSTGGGGGSTWSWMGENPTLAKDYGTTKVWLKDTGYATWTPSTTSTKIADSVNLEACTGMNYDDYDYIIVGKVHSHFEYGSGATGTAQPSDYYVVYYNYIYGINSNKENMDNGTINNATSRSINGQSGLFYLNTAGVQSFGNYSYGVTVYTAPSLTVNYSFGTVTPKSPQMNAVCNASYFSTDNAVAVNQNTSYYEYRVLIYRVNHWTSDGGNIWGLMRDMWLNGI